MWLAWGGLALMACDGGDAETDVAPDPRWDRAAWPTTVGGERPAAVHAPASADEAELLPVIVLLHGYGVNGGVQDLYWGLSARVDTHDYVLIVPEGTENGTGQQFWNATVACCDFENTDVDDVAYLDGLVAEAETTMPIDPDRIVFMGHSNGGFMSHRMGCDRSDRVAAVVSLAGSLFPDDDDCAADAPVAALQIHGDADATILYAGTATYPSAEETVERWSIRNGCAGDRAATATVDYDSTVGADETELSGHADCDAPADLWRMRGSSHAPAVNDAWRDATVEWALAQRKVR